MATQLMGLSHVQMIDPFASMDMMSRWYSI